MSARDATLDDARVLLEALAAHGWASAVVRIGDKEFAIARDGELGGFDQIAAPDSLAPAAAAVTVAAPHVGTLIELAEIGRAVTKGEAVAVLAVLDEQVEVPAPADGRISEHGAQSGILVEYGEALIRIAT